jgi:hypothetical protein
MQKKIIIKFIGLVLALMSLLCGMKLQAQEFNCIVDINSQKIQSSDKQVFDVLKSAVFDFMNNMKWSTLTMLPIEKIECNVSIILQEQNGSRYTGVLTIQMRRPVFNSSYSSVILNFQDKDFEFTYEENEPLLYADQHFSSNLTGVLAFYSYFGIGLYLDTYGMEGGMVFLDKAMEIVNLCQSFPEPGWKANARNQSNRYWLAENYTNGNWKTIHEVQYMYHRMGLDQMYSNANVARTAILNSIILLEELNQKKPNLPAKQFFIQAKKDELVNIFKNGTQEEKAKLIEKMKLLDPSGMSQYQEILK